MSYIQGKIRHEFTNFHRLQRNMINKIYASGTIFNTMAV